MFRHFVTQYMTETRLHFAAGWLASLSLLCTSISRRVQDIGSAAQHRRPARNSDTVSAAFVHFHYAST